MSELILLTSSFPNYPDEPFLEKEFAYLEGHFDRISFVTVAPQASTEGKTTDYRGHEVYEISLTSSGKLKTLLSAIVNPYLLTEAKYILSRLPFGSFLSAFKVAVVSWNKSKKLKQIVERKLEQSGSQNVIIYSYWGDEGAIAAALLADHPKVQKVVTRVHGWDVNFSVHQPAYLPFRSLIQKRCSGIFPISDFGKQQIKNVWKVPTHTVFVARLGVDKQELSERKDDEAVFTLVSCSNLIPLKRVELIAEAVLNVQEPIRWIHFGDGPERENIRLATRNSKPWQEIIFKGKVQNEEVLDFYRKNRVDLFINASTTEGIPFSIMEVMSFGIPVLATDVGGNSEIVNETNGYLLPTNPTSEQISNQIEQFIRISSKEMEQFKYGAYATWEKKYNAQTNFSAFVQKLLDVKN